MRSISFGKLLLGAVLPPLVALLALASYLGYQCFLDYQTVGRTASLQKLAVAAAQLAAVDLATESKLSTARSTGSSTQSMARGIEDAEADSDTAFIGARCSA